MESLNSIKSSDSDISINSHTYENLRESSTNSLLALQTKHLSPTNILKFSNIP